ncbi:MAG: hypothetical protein WC795_03395 [Candidatus Paceibacterota bacterium]|jgi:hypothetical protein
MNYKLRIINKNAGKKLSFFPIHNSSFVIYNSAKRGFVVLFAVLISSIILSITIGLSSLSYKEIKLSSSASEGNHAFYAADTGIECVLRYALSQGGFPQSGMFCDNAVILYQEDSSSTYIDISSADSQTAKPYCAYISYTKGAPGGANTVIESRGYNVSCSDIQNPDSVGYKRAVERSLQVSYPETE